MGDAIHENLSHEKFLHKQLKQQNYTRHSGCPVLMKYFKRKNELPDPKGPLSAVINPSAIAVANKEVKDLSGNGTSIERAGKRGRYNR